MTLSPPLQAWVNSALAPWRTVLLDRTRMRLAELEHGDTQRWDQALHTLPELFVEHVHLNHDAISVSGPLNDTAREQLITALRQLHPWRKGPFELFGVHIDTEWRSDWKWQRVAPHLRSLVGKTVLDVGCGNGYHLWRMRGAGAAVALGIDPTLVYLAQYQALQHYIRDRHVDMLPLRSEDLPEHMHCFDTVFSMGVIYHRRDPVAHLRELHSALRHGGEVILETLIVNSEEETLLVPRTRYAKMRNVWGIPSSRTAQRWLEEADFADIRCVDITPTTTLEQRTTDWMKFESLTDFLNPMDATHTVEGYPSPVRAVFIATKT